MNELDKQSMAALERLCAQFELEQRRHGEQIATLRQQVEQQAEQIATLRQRIEQQDAASEIWRRESKQLDGQVTRLAQDYSTLAEILRERWR